MFIREGDNLHVTISVPAVDAALGTKTSLELLDGSSESVEIPAGTQPDEQIRLPGQGMPHLRREGHGNLIVHVDVTVPTNLSHKQRELLEQLREHSKENVAVNTKGGQHSGLFSRLRKHFSRA